MDKNEKIINIDGVDLPQSVWDEIKDSYVSPKTTAHEQEIIDDIIRLTQTTVLALDRLITVDDYVPEGSSEDMFNIAHYFINDSLTQIAMNRDEVVTSRMLELLTGIKEDVMENQVIAIIEQCARMQKLLEYKMYH